MFCNDIALDFIRTCVNGCRPGVVELAEYVDMGSVEIDFAHVRPL